MSNRTIFYLTAIFLVMLTPVAQSQPDRNDSADYMTFYYLNPQPDKAPQMLLGFFQSEVFTVGGCDAHCQDITAYFFSRIAQDNPELVQQYIDLFERGSHDQRLLLLMTLQYCGNSEVEQYFTSQLERGRFTKEKRQILAALRLDMPVQLDVTRKPITQAGDLDFLWAEFMVTGRPEPVQRIISFLHWLDDGHDTQLIIGGAVRWSLTSNAKTHKQSIGNL